MSDTKDNVFWDMNERMIVLSDEIDHSSVGTIVSSVLSWNRDDDSRRKKEKKFSAQPIRLYVQSYGGIVYDAWALIDVIIGSKTPVYTYCYGAAMSAAFLIFLAGHKRYASKHATLMYHQMSLRESGTFQDLVENHEENNWLQDKIEEYVDKQCKISKKTLNEIRKSKKDFYIHADKFRELGLVDEVL